MADPEVAVDATIAAVQVVARAAHIQADAAEASKCRVHAVRIYATHLTMDRYLGRIEAWWYGRSRNA